VIGCQFAIAGLVLASNITIASCPMSTGFAAFYRLNDSVAFQAMQES
jgi:hypothetical protein